MHCKKLYAMKVKNSDDDSLKDFYNGKNIFITGGSGFIGKAIIEKLLRSCPDVGKIYILLRSKKNKSMNDRLEQMLTSPVFDLIKSKSPECLKKIIPINGDTSKLALGISETDRNLLKTEINIFINAAASVRFDEMIRDAIIFNIRSAREAALLALEMKNIITFVHVSTAYCNIEREVVEEVLYPPPQSWKDAISMAENCDSHLIDVLSQKCIGDFPNTYTYTKRLAEHCINEILVGKVTTIICRPSVVTSSVDEPFEGWTDNLNGPTGLLIAGYTGVLRIAYGTREKEINYIPVDNVAKGILVAIWHKVRFGNIQELTIYHQTKVGSFPHKMGDFVTYEKKTIWDIPIEKTLWYPRARMTSCFYDYFFFMILTQIIPALFLDAILKIIGRQPFFVKIQRKIFFGNNAISYFMKNEWTFINRNIFQLFQALPMRDRKDFNFLIFPESDQTLYNYFAQAKLYFRQHVLKENGKTTQANTNRTKRLYVLDLLTTTMLKALVAWLVIVKLNIPGKIWKYLYDYWNEL